jgi:hypothetical protein
MPWLKRIDGFWKGETKRNDRHEWRLSFVATYSAFFNASRPRNVTIRHHFEAAKALLNTLGDLEF